MEEVDNAVDPDDNAIDPDNDISYGYEVMIVNDREIFLRRKIGKRTLNNNYTIGWSCKNKPSCTASILSTRDEVNLEASDYNVERKNTKMGITAWITNLL